MKTIILGLLTVHVVISVSPLHAKQINCIVTVVDIAGYPIQGATVSAWEHHYHNTDCSVIVEQRVPPTQTDKNGNANIKINSKISENSLFVFAQKDGYSIGWNGVFCTARITEIRIVLDEANITAGTVTDEQNRPIAGAKVTAHPVDEIMVEGNQSHFRWPDSILTTTTDSRGRFRFDCFTDWMEVRFTAEYPGRAFTDTSWNLQAERLRYNKTNRNDIHITMHPAGRIEGRILAKRGHPVSGIMLAARGERIRNGQRFITLSNADGRFSFEDLPADTYLVTTVVSDPTQQITAGTVAEVQSGQTVENVRIRMRDPVQLEVMVKNINTDEPISNASVHTSQIRPSLFAPHLQFTTKTDSRGIARIITLPGKCNIGFSHDGYEGSYGDYLIKSTDTNLLIGLTPKSIITVTGEVVYRDGREAEGIDVEASTFETERKLTDANGNFRIIFSVQRAQKGFVIARDRRTGLAGVVDITETTGPVKVVLTEAATLKGRVTDPDNNPIHMAKVDVSYNIPYTLKRIGNSLYTNENGEFELRAVPYARENLSYRLSASAYGYSLIKYEKIEVRKEGGEIIDLPPFVLKPCNMTLSGVAVYEDGSAAAHKQVHLNNVHNMHGQPALHSVTDENGKFEFEGACKGWLRIQCGSVMQNDCGFTYAKGGDTVNVIMNNNYHSLQMHAAVDNYEGIKLPMLDRMTQGIEPKIPENKKLLICFWWLGYDECKEILKQLAEISDKLDAADIFVILVNSRPYSKQYASINIGKDKQFIKDNHIPFAEADVPIMEDIMEIRRAAGAKLLPWLILTDNNKVITNEGFNIQWLKDNVL